MCSMVEQSGGPLPQRGSQPQKSTEGTEGKPFVPSVPFVANQRLNRDCYAGHSTRSINVLLFATIWVAVVWKIWIGDIVEIYRADGLALHCMTEGPFEDSAAVNSSMLAPASPTDIW